MLSSLSLLNYTVAIPYGCETIPFKQKDDHQTALIDRQASLLSGL